MKIDVPGSEAKILHKYLFPTTSVLVLAESCLRKKKEKTQKDVLKHMTRRKKGKLYKQARKKMCWGRGVKEELLSKVKPTKQLK